METRSSLAWCGSDGVQWCAGLPCNGACREDRASPKLFDSSALSFSNLPLLWVWLPEDILRALASPSFCPTIISVTEKEVKMDLPEGFLGGIGWIWARRLH